MKSRERAEALGYRLEKAEGEDRWRALDLYSDRSGPWMTSKSMLAWLDRMEAVRRTTKLGG
jgi:hypothetical protein